MYLYKYKIHLNNGEENPMSCAGRVEMSSLCVADALVGAATASCGRKGPSDKSMVSPAACQNQRVTSPLRRTVAPATAMKVHKGWKLKGQNYFCFFSPFQLTRDNASVCFPTCDAGGARQWASTRLGRWAGLKAKSTIWVGCIQLVLPCACVSAASVIQTRTCTLTQLLRATHRTSKTCWVTMQPTWASSLWISNPELLTSRLFHRDSVLLSPNRNVAASILLLQLHVFLHTLCTF